MLFINLHVRVVEFVILVKPIGILTHVTISFGTKIPTFLNILVLIKAFIICQNFQNFLCLQGSFFRRVTSSSLVSFPFLSRRTRHGGVGEMSGTRVEIPPLGWAFAPKDSSSV